MKFKSVLTIVCLFPVLTLASAYAQDSWNGGSGNWSGPGNWSLGTVPGPGDDVVIYSGGNDYVILDPGTASINSLTLGGISNGFTSELTDNGVPQTLSCTNALNVGENGQLFLYGGSSASAGASSNNSGVVGLGNGSALHVNADLSNSGTLLSGLHGLGGNSLTITGILTNQARGGFTVDGPGDVATLGGLVNFFGSDVLVERGSTLQINGAVNNSGAIATFYPSFADGSTLNISGTLTNNGDFFLFTTGDVANVESLINNLAVFVLPHATLNAGSFVNAGSFGSGGELRIFKGATVNVANGFYQLATGTLGESIGASGFGILVAVDGSVMLDGTLDVLRDPTFNPAIGTTYKFFLFEPGELSGTFASIQNQYFNNGTEGWRVIYDNADGYVELEAAPAPEPASLLLLGAGLLGTVVVLRRKINL